MITRHPRFNDGNRWVKGSWTGNAFALYHKLFWTRCGRNGIGDNIRAFSIQTEDFETGEKTLQCFTWEAVFMNVEAQFRAWLRELKIPRVRIVSFAPAFPSGAGLVGMPPIFSFAIAVDTSTQDGNFALTQTPGQSITSSYTMSSTANGALFVGEQFSTTTGSDPVVTQTYNGTGMTSYQYQDSNTIGSMSVRYLLGPSSGTHNIAINTGTVVQRYIAAASYTGVKQSGFPDATGTGSPQVISVATSNIAGSTTSSADNCWAFIWANNDTGQAVSAGTNTTIRQNIASQGFAWADPNAAKTPAGTITLNLSFAGNCKIIGIYGSFAPAVAAAVNSNFLGFM